MPRPDDPLDQPVRVGAASHGFGSAPAYLVANVRPADVLAALDDEQREAMVHRGLDAIEALPDYEPTAEDAARAVVAALCDREEKTDAAS